MEILLGKESNMVVLVQKNMHKIAIIRWQIYWRQNKTNKVERNVNDKLKRCQNKFKILL